MLSSASTNSQREKSRSELVTIFVQNIIGAKSTRAVLQKVALYIIQTGEASSDSESFMELWPVVATHKPKTSGTDARGRSVNDFAELLKEFVNSVNSSYSTLVNNALGDEDVQKEVKHNISYEEPQSCNSTALVHRMLSYAAYHLKVLVDSNPLTFKDSPMGCSSDNFPISIGMFVDGLYCSLVTVITSVLHGTSDTSVKGGKKKKRDLSDLHEQDARHIHPFLKDCESFIVAQLAGEAASLILRSSLVHALECKKETFGLMAHFSKDSFVTVGNTEPFLKTRRLLSDGEVTPSNLDLVGSEGMIVARRSLVISRRVGRLTLAPTIIPTDRGVVDRVSSGIVKMLGGASSTPEPPYELCAENSLIVPCSAGNKVAKFTYESGVTQWEHKHTENLHKSESEGQALANTVVTCSCIQLCRYLSEALYHMWDSDGSARDDALLKLFFKAGFRGNGDIVSHQMPILLELSSVAHMIPVGSIDRVLLVQGDRGSRKMHPDPVVESHKQIMEYLRAQNLGCKKKITVDNNLYKNLINNTDFFRVLSNFFANSSADNQPLKFSLTATARYIDIDFAFTKAHVSGKMWWIDFRIESCITCVGLPLPLSREAIIAGFQNRKLALQKEQKTDFSLPSQTIADTLVAKKKLGSTPTDWMKNCIKAVADYSRPHPQMNVGISAKESVVELLVSNLALEYLNQKYLMFCGGHGTHQKPVKLKLDDDTVILEPFSTQFLGEIRKGFIESDSYRTISTFAYAAEGGADSSSTVNTAIEARAFSAFWDMFLRLQFHKVCFLGIEVVSIDFPFTSINSQNPKDLCKISAFVECVGVENIDQSNSEMELLARLKGSLSNMNGAIVAFSRVSGGSCKSNVYGQLTYTFPISEILLFLPFKARRTLYNTIQARCKESMRDAQTSQGLVEDPMVRKAKSMIGAMKLHAATHPPSSGYFTAGGVEAEQFTGQLHSSAVAQHLVSELTSKPDFKGVHQMLSDSRVHVGVRPEEIQEIVKECSRNFFESLRAISRNKVFENVLSRRCSISEAGFMDDDLRAKFGRAMTHFALPASGQQTCVIGCITAHKGDLLSPILLDKDVAERYRALVHNRSRSRSIVSDDNTTDQCADLESFLAHWVDHSLLGNIVSGMSSPPNVPTNGVIVSSWGDELQPLCARGYQEILEYHITMQDAGSGVSTEFSSPAAIVYAKVVHNRSSKRSSSELLDLLNFCFVQFPHHSIDHSGDGQMSPVESFEGLCFPPRQSGQDRDQLFYSGFQVLDRASFNGKNRIREMLPSDDKQVRGSSSAGEYSTSDNGYSSNQDSKCSGSEDMSERRKNKSRRSTEGSALASYYIPCIALFPETTLYLDESRFKKSLDASKVCLFRVLAFADLIISSALVASSGLRGILDGAYCATGKTHLVRERYEIVEAGNSSNDGKLVVNSLEEVGKSRSPQLQVVFKITGMIGSALDSSGVADSSHPVLGPLYPLISNLLLSAFYPGMESELLSKGAQWVGSQIKTVVKSTSVDLIFTLDTEKFMQIAQSAIGNPLSQFSQRETFVRSSNLITEFFKGMGNRNDLPFLRGLGEVNYTFAHHQIMLSRDDPSSHKALFDLRVRFTPNYEMVGCYDFSQGNHGRQSVQPSACVNYQKVKSLFSLAGFLKSPPKTSPRWEDLYRISDNSVVEFRDWRKVKIEESNIKLDQGNHDVVLQCEGIPVFHHDLDTDKHMHNNNAYKLRLVSFKGLDSWSLRVCRIDNISGELLDGRCLYGSLAPKIAKCAIGVIEAFVQIDASDHPALASGPFFSPIVRMDRMLRNLFKEPDELSRSHDDAHTVGHIPKAVTLRDSLLDHQEPAFSQRYETVHSFEMVKGRDGIEHCTCDVPKVLIATQGKDVYPMIGFELSGEAALAFNALFKEFMSKTHERKQICYLTSVSYGMKGSGVSSNSTKIVNPVALSYFIPETPLMREKPAINTPPMYSEGIVCVQLRLSPDNLHASLDQLERFLSFAESAFIQSQSGHDNPFIAQSHIRDGFWGNTISIFRSSFNHYGLDISTERDPSADRVHPAVIAPQGTKKRKFVIAKANFNTDNALGFHFQFSRGFDEDEMVTQFRRSISWVSRRDHLTMAQDALFYDKLHTVDQSAFQSLLYFVVPNEEDRVLAINDREPQKKGYIKIITQLVSLRVFMFLNFAGKDHLSRFVQGCFRNIPGIHDFLFKEDGHGGMQHWLGGLNGTEEADQAVFSSIRSLLVYDPTTLQIKGLPPYLYTFVDNTDALGHQYCVQDNSWMGNAMIYDPSIEKSIGDSRTLVLMTLFNSVLVCAESRKWGVLEMHPIVLVSEFLKTSCVFRVIDLLLCNLEKRFTKSHGCSAKESLMVQFLGVQPAGSKGGITSYDFIIAFCNKKSGSRPLSVKNSSVSANMSLAATEELDNPDNSDVSVSLANIGVGGTTGIKLSVAIREQAFGGGLSNSAIATITEGELSNKLPAMHTINDVCADLFRGCEDAIQMHKHNSAEDILAGMSNRRIAFNVLMGIVISGIASTAVFSGMYLTKKCDLGLSVVVASIAGLLGFLLCSVVLFTACHHSLSKNKSSSGMLESSDAPDDGSPAAVVGSTVRINGIDCIDLTPNPSSDCSSSRGKG